jgi:ubiquinone/menaquinone biosynthesis C-methylase UbiE
MSQPWQTYLDRIEKRLIHNFMTNGDWFIDLGGGNGRLLDLYKNAYRNIVILDYSMSMLRDANQRLLRSRVQNVSLIAADVYHLPFVRNVFDAAMMVRLAHHVEDPASIIYETHRVLKPRAAFLFEYQNKRNVNFLFKGWLRIMKFQEINSLAPLQVGRLHWNFHPRSIERILKDGFEASRTLGGGLFWNRSLLTRSIPHLEAIDLALAPFLGRYSLTHQLFLTLQAKKSETDGLSRVRHRNSSLLEILQCPHCHCRSLAKRNQALICPQCIRSYEINDNVYDFRLGTN